MCMDANCVPILIYEGYSVLIIEVDSLCSVGYKLDSLDSVPDDVFTNG